MAFKGSQVATMCHRDVTTGLAPSFPLPPASTLGGKAVSSVIALVPHRSGGTVTVHHKQGNR